MAPGMGMGAETAIQEYAGKAVAKETETVPDRDWGMG